MAEITDEEVVAVVTEVKRLSRYLEFMYHRPAPPEAACLKEDLETWYKAAALAARFLEQSFGVKADPPGERCGRPDCPSCGAPTGEVVH